MCSLHPTQVLLSFFSTPSVQNGVRSLHTFHDGQSARHAVLIRTMCSLRDVLWEACLHCTQSQGGMARAAAGALNVNLRP
jgi:hypothetical protein